MTKKLDRAKLRAAFKAVQEAYAVLEYRQAALDELFARYRLPKDGYLFDAAWSNDPDINFDKALGLDIAQGSTDG